MFWSGNFIVVRELNFLLKEENVTLSQVLEADDILQECKADNKALVQFLTRPDILAELITLITEEPSASLELAQQYRHASIACEVLTSPLSSLSDRLSLDTAQMNRLCDFINRDPPLNPLLASYFSKTIEMLLERNPKQDWYLYHIVCLRVLDFFKSRRDFLPNLVRHMSTSAIADTFKYFIRLDDLFNKFVMEWLEEHQFIECLIQIICGTYSCEGGARGGGAPDQPEKGQRECSEKENDTRASHTDDGTHDHENNECPPQEEAGAAHRRARTGAVAAANAAELLCELIATGCAAEGAVARSRTSWALVGKLSGGNGPRALLQAVFTCPVTSRASALAHGTRLLRRLLEHHATIGSEGGTPRSQVELAVAPHLPLLHQALLRDPATYAQEDGGALGGGESREVPGLGGVGAARVQTAALLAHLACSEVEEVATTMLTLGTPAVLVDMFFRYPHNNFLHATLLAFVRNALANPAYRTQYTTHLLVENDLLSKLMDAFEENENKQIPGPRAGYMGHVTLILSRLQCALVEDTASLAPPAAPYDTPPSVPYDVPSMVCYDTTMLPPAAASRWRPFCDEKLDIALHHFTQPLGGTYPSDNSYEADNSISDKLTSYYDASATDAEGAGAGAGAEGAGAAAASHMDDDKLMNDDEQYYRDAAKNRFMELADQRFTDDMWDDAPEGEEEEEAAGDALRDELAEGSPWESHPSSEPANTEDGWAQFGGLAAALPPADPFADQYQGGLQHFWPYEGDQPNSADMSPSLLANNLLTAMSGMSPAAIANIVNANLDLQPLPSRSHLMPDGEAATLPSEDIPSGFTNDTHAASEGARPASVSHTGLHDVSTQLVHDARDKGDITTEHVTDVPEDNTHASINDAPAEVTDASVVLNASQNSFPNTIDAESDAVVSLDCSNVPNAAPAASPTPDERSISTDSSLVVQNPHLNDVTVKLNDICLRDDHPSDTGSPAEGVSETSLDNDTVSDDAAEVSETAER